MPTFTIRASKNGDTTTTVRVGPTITVAKARELSKAGWTVQIIDEDGSVYGPSEFDHCFRSIAQKKRNLTCRTSDFAGKYLDRS